jgi:hypothetical protein
MEEPRHDRMWLIPWLLPLALVAIVVCATLLPVWAFILVGVAAIVAGLPLVWRVYARGRPGIELPSWLPGGRPGNR